MSQGTRLKSRDPLGIPQHVIQRYRPPSSLMQHGTSSVSSFPCLLGTLLSRYLPLPSMLTWTPCSCNIWVKASLVNCAPWSVSNISGRPWFNASSNAATQKPVSRVLESFQASTCRLAEGRHRIHTALVCAGSPVRPGRGAVCGRGFRVEPLVHLAGRCLPAGLPAGLLVPRGHRIPGHTRAAGDGQRPRTSGSSPTGPSRGAGCSSSAPWTLPSPRSASSSAGDSRASSSWPTTRLSPFSPSFSRLSGSASPGRRRQPLPMSSCA